jgi:hypothetical protein
MKTANIPSLRVEPELRHAVETALHDDETLSSFMENRHFESRSSSDNSRMNSLPGAWHQGITQK